MQRRTVLAAGLGGLALVGTAGVWRVTRTPDSAYVPWKLSPLGDEDIRLHSFRHAILAPNPHNRQPWVIEMQGDNEAVISCDLKRRLPVTDPFDRQITIGFGTFLEIARIAAAERGYAINAQLFPEGEAQPRLDGRPIAHLSFSKQAGINADPLFQVITKRRSNKEIYDLSRKVSETDLQKITSDGGGYSVDPDFVAKLRTEILKSINAELTTPAAYQESVDLMRIGYKQVSANPDGIDLSGPMIEAGILAGQIDHKQLADMDSQAYKIGLDQTNETYGSVPSVLWIKTGQNSRKDQIEAGRQYVRANLRAAQSGLAMHPMSQSLQEYKEVAESYKTVHTMLGAEDGERIQMLARVGYGPKTGPSPRWPVETLMK